MAKKKKTSRGRRSSPRRTRDANPADASLEPERGEDAFGGDLEGSGPRATETTGRVLVTFVDSSAAGIRSGLSSLRSSSGLARVCRSADFAAETFDIDAADDAEVLVFDEIGVAVVQGDPGAVSQVRAVSSEADTGLVTEPEYFNYAIGFDALEPAGDAMETLAGAHSVSADFLEGYRRGVNALVDAALGGGTAGLSALGAAAAASYRDSPSATWGLQATLALRSRYSGRGVRVAVLDTGMDLRHPDFAGRVIQSQSFVSGEAVQDGHGHGTHCIGTACGPERPGIGPRYGVAYSAEIYAGKVLSNAGRGRDGDILAGINWAIRNRCKVVSMSLGRRVIPGEAPMTSYQTAARRGLQAGTLIVAAAGNDSRRPGQIVPVSSPANCPSIAAVAALDSSLRVASFSNGGVNPNGGEINLAAPGVNVLSAWPMPTRTRIISGTSMATPHVAGLAALLAEETPSLVGIPLYRELARRARSLPLPGRDVGNGLAEAL